MKSATELGITEQEHIALQGVAAGLAAGIYVHGADAVGEKIFNMHIQCTSQGCGTIGCIGGWVGREMGLSVVESSEYVEVAGDYDKPLEPLYYPDNELNWYKITPAIAAAAIYNFLETGKPDYEGLLAA